MPQSLKIAFGCGYAISEIAYTGTIGSFPTLTRAFPWKPDELHYWQWHSGGNRQASASDVGTRKYSSIFSTWDSCLANIPTPAVVWKNCNLCTYFAKYRRWTNKRKLRLKKQGEKKGILPKCNLVLRLSLISEQYHCCLQRSDLTHDVRPLLWTQLGWKNTTVHQIFSNSVKKKYPATGSCLYIHIYNRSFCYLRMSGRRRWFLRDIFMLTKVLHAIFRKLQ